MTPTEETLASYQKAFPTAVNAYCYALLNRYYPHWLVLSTDNKSSLLNDLDRELKTTPLVKPDELLALIKKMGVNRFKGCTDDPDSVGSLTKRLNHLNYASTDWSSPDAWDAVKAELDFSKPSPVLSGDERKTLLKKMKAWKDQFGLRDVALNPNSHPDRWLQECGNGINQLAQLLDFNPGKFGLGKLTLGWKTEEGNFTGISHPRDNSITIKGNHVLAHEWMHFLDSENHDIPHRLDWMSTNSPEDHKRFSRKLEEFGYGPIASFEKQLKHPPITQQTYSAEEWVQRFQGAALFLQPYAKDSEKFSAQVQSMVTEFLADSNETKGLKSLEQLVDSQCPPRYFSFLRAEMHFCKQHLQNKPNDLSFYSFAKKADELGKLGRYTQCLQETFARTFESFIEAQTQEKNLNCALIRPCTGGLYPQGEERRAIVEWWEGAFDVLKNKSLMGKYPKPVPAPNALPLNNIPLHKLQSEKPPKNAKRSSKIYLNGESSNPSSLGSVRK